MTMAILGSSAFSWMIAWRAPLHVPDPLFQHFGHHISTTPNCCLRRSDLKGLKSPFRLVQSPKWNQGQNPVSVSDNCTYIDALTPLDIALAICCVPKSCGKNKNVPEIGELGRVTALINWTLSRQPRATGEERRNLRLLCSHIAISVSDHFCQKWDRIKGIQWAPLPWPCTLNVPISTLSQNTGNVRYFGNITSRVSLKLCICCKRLTLSVSSPKAWILAMNF